MEKPSPRAPVVLVYTMGRVGSTAVFLALQHLGDTVFHTHYLHPDAIAKQRAKTSPGKAVLDGRRAAALLESSTEDVKIVSLVRDPIERNLSAAFVSWRRTVQGEPDLRHVTREAVESHWRTFSKARPLVWFETQMKDALGLDVYQYPFLHDRVTFRSGRFEVLVMKSSMPDVEKSRLISDLVGQNVKVEQLPDSNRWDQVYEQFKTFVPLTEDYVREVAGAQYTRHFFEPNEGAYVQRWLGPRRR